MRILVVGNMNFRSSPFQFAQALKDIGHNVRTLSDANRHRIPGVTDDPGLYTRLRGKLGYHHDTTNINERLREATTTIEPDAILFVKTLTIRPETLDWLQQESGATLVFVAGDNMAKKHNHSKYFCEGVNRYDAVFKARGYSPDFYRDHNVDHLFDFDLGYYEPLMSPRRPERPYQYNVAFIGSYEDERRRYIQTLAETGVDVHVWGNGWSGVGSTKTLQIHDRPVYGIEYVATMHDAKICLNFYRKLNDDVMNSRVFEIPASESFMLSQRTEDPFTFFEPGVEADYFGSTDELIKQVEYYLNRDSKRRSMARAGRERCLESGYCYRKRTYEMIEELNQCNLV